MNIVIINSGRKNGNTFGILELLIESLFKNAELLHADININYFALCNQNIKTCIGCRSCFDKDICPLKDDVALIEDSILNSDAIILASPVYMEDVNGMMKTLIDRMAVFAHRPQFYGKCAAVLTTSGAGCTNHSINTMKNALSAWGFKVIAADKVKMSAYLDSDKYKEQIKEQLFNTAKKLINAIENHSAQNPSMLSLISFKIQQKFYNTCDRVGAKDREYWEKNGFLLPKVNYYMPIKSNALKLLTAKALGAILAKVFI